MQNNVTERTTTFDVRSVKLQFFKQNDQNDIMMSFNS
jgi:hypothetical protein